MKMSESAIQEIPGHLLQTWVAESQRPAPETARDALLVHIYPTGPGMGSRYALRERPLVIGRGADCDIRIEDQSVSRRHARVEADAGTYCAVDLQSTNGTFVNNMPATKSTLNDGDYLRVGNCIYRFLMGGNVEAEYHEEIYRLTIIDALTGLHNKRFLMEFLDRELARSARRGRPLSLVLFDIDHFKAVNDNLGHLGGDYTLSELAASVRRGIRKDELFARYGGEEFAIVLPEVAHDEATLAAERVRVVVEQHPFAYEGEAYPITISLGVATTAGDASLTPQELLRRADEKLYLAKREGRNRVEA